MKLEQECGSREGESREEQLRGLYQKRCALLEKIHADQQALDEIDYLIHRIKTGRGGAL